MVAADADRARRLVELTALRRVRDRIDREYAQPLDVEDSGPRAHMSAGHLGRQFRSAYGEPPYRYLMTRRVERAMMLLRRGDVSVTQAWTIHSTFLPHLDPDASLAFYRDVLGFEVRLDVGYEGMRWITVGPPGGGGTSIVLQPPAADPGITETERAVLKDLMAKGTYAGLLIAVDDLDAAFERIEASGADVVQEPMEQDWGLRDCAFRDPAGNTIRLQQSTH